MDDIFEKFRNLHAEMEVLFDDFFRLKHPFALGTEKRWRPSVDMYETKDEIVVIAELSGVKKEDINISASKKALYLSGTRRETAGSSKRHYYSMEIRFGPFERLIRLPARVNLKKLKTNLESGLLKIRIPKAEEPDETVVEIE